MKHKVAISIIVTSILLFWLFPRVEAVEYEHLPAVTPEFFVVEISGAVIFPGTYHFFEPLTVSEAIDYAGGTKNDADLGSFQPAEAITKNRQLFVPSRNIQINEQIVRINVNKASFKELITIPGMTETRAASLIVYREGHGQFIHADELLNVKNIGPATLEKIRPYIAFE
ncbi:MAG: helix-hairpin-helix domain-containing protein [Acholeplasmataceae bacterium]|nr:helix-hairpin-helix domain-containing protein [Acholeplasmataceae bacterium]